MQNKIKDLKKIIAEEEKKGGNFKRAGTAPISATKVLAMTLFINSVLLFLCMWLGSGWTCYIGSFGCMDTSPDRS